ncbi:PREDICTED: chymotrypsin-1-like [Nicrophorus vespilloides]|uniref:Chymotrypsin-1-like n=1 Tax=Nicrophorus vespilloides TaxID=110193 RepID=A0ABM1NDD5_NICVS|nr:PREDICTED: chymotrypsin-1-like [Nicrophorus vespilloides]
MDKLMLILLLVFLVGFAVSLKRDDRIVHGFNANYEDFPYMVSMKFLKDGDTMFCGGTLIADRWILTAAHCIFNIRLNNIKVYTGSGTIFQNTQQKVEKLIPHEDYIPKVTGNDIGLIRLASPVDGITFVELESEKRNGTGILVGWGFTEHRKESRKLQKLDVRYGNCPESFARALRFDSRNFICTSTENGKGACGGDSGGPLIDFNSKKQIGVVSSGVPCAKGFPDVFTYIPKYLDWIKQKMKK